MARSLDDLRALIDRVKRPGRLKICIDICHLYINEYDLYFQDARKTFFDTLERIGFENIAAVHISDSNVQHGQKKDAHAK